MGEIADMMLEGIMCQGCGEFLGEGDGFPTWCAGCAPDGVEDELFPMDEPVAHYTTKYCCQHCNGKAFKSFKAITDHLRGKHGISI